LLNIASLIDQGRGMQIVRQRRLYQKLRVKIRNWLNTGDGRNNRWAGYIMCAVVRNNTFDSLIVEVA
jgi:hypothetical protein